MLKRIFISFLIIAVYILSASKFVEWFYYAQLLPADVATVLGMGLGLLIILYILRHYGIKMIKWDQLTLPKVIKVILTGFVATTLANVTIVSLLPETAMRNQNSVSQMVAVSSPLMMFILVVIVGPLLEEIVFRGIFLKLIFPKRQLFAVLVSSVLFALAHNGTTLTEFVVYFIPGLILGFIAYQFKGIEYAFTYHAFSNAVALFVMISGVV